MTAIELKNMLIHQIASINDEDFLNAIKTIIEAKTNSTTYQTSAEQKQKIEEGLKQIEKGYYFTNEEVESEIDKWLEEK